MTTNPIGKYKGGKLRYKRRCTMTLNIELMKEVKEWPEVISRGLSEVVEAYLAKRNREYKLSKGIAECQ